MSLTLIALVIAYVFVHVIGNDSLCVSSCMMHDACPEQAHVIVETSDCLCSQLTLLAPDICTAAGQEGVQLHLHTAGSPLSTQVGQTNT